MTRRCGMLGVVAVALLAVGAGYWFRPTPPAPPLPPETGDEEVLEAIRVARDAVLAEPRSAAAWGELGMVALAQQFDREADVCFVEATRLDPLDARWPYGRAIIGEKRRPDEAVALFRAAAAATQCAPSLKTPIQVRLAEALLERGQLDEAEGVFREEYDRSNNARAALGLGVVARTRGQFDAAARWLTEAQSSPYTRRTATAQLAALARARGDAALAVLYEKQLATIPDDGAWPDPFQMRLRELRVGRRGFNQKVAALEHDEQYGEAAELYLRRLQKYPSAELYAGAALNLARLPSPDYDRIIPLAREAVRREPANAYAQYLLGRVLYNRAERAWQTTPGDAAARQWFEEAMTRTRRAAELRPNYADAYLYWGLALKYLGQREAALEPLRRGVACRPGAFLLQLALGELLLDLGHAEQAKTPLEQAHALEPANPHVEQLWRRVVQATYRE